MTASSSGPGGAARRETWDTIVVGAGFSGLYLIHRLREYGFTVRCFEAGDDVGGTWYWNRYPGARVDAEVLFYSYSFSPELQQEWTWSERYATQPELHRYLRHVADRFRLRDHIRFNSRVTSATFDEAGRHWVVTTDRGEVSTARYLIMATGCLSAAKPPEVPGIEDFPRVHHTATWPQEGVDVRDQRVGLVGTGSSGVQAIPVIGRQAAELTVFQRTAPFAFPAMNAPLDPAVEADVKANYPAMRQAARESPFGLPNMQFNPQSALEVSPEERNAAYERALTAGRLDAPLTVFSDLLTDLEANATAAEFLRDRVRKIVKDPVTASILCLNDYPIGTKRPCLETDYYETYNLENVRVVDLRETPIERITATGIQTSRKAYEFDIIVFATGFDAMTGSLTRVDIRGRGGRSLQQEWASGPETYLGLQAVGFPNLFLVTGPGSPSVLSNMLVSIEQHVEWISDCIRDMRDLGWATIEPDPPAAQAWTEHVQDVAKSTLYYHANSWYLGANVPGKPRIFMPYVGGVGLYRRICSEVAQRSYEGFILADADANRLNSGSAETHLPDTVLEAAWQTAAREG